MKVIINDVLYAPKVEGLQKQQFGSLIRAARIKLNKSLDEVAKDINTNKANVWALEQGRSEPKLRTIKKLLDYYGLDFKDVDFFNPPTFFDPPQD